MHRCDETNLNKVAFYVAENQIMFPGCKNGLCDWEYIKQTFGSLAQNCSSDFCQIKSENYPIEVTNLTFESTVQHTNNQ